MRAQLGNYLLKRRGETQYNWDELGIHHQNVFRYLRNSCWCSSDPRDAGKGSSWDTKTCFFLSVLPLGRYVQQKGRQGAAQGRNILKHCSKTFQSWPSVLFNTGFLQTSFWSRQSWASHSTSKNAVVSTSPSYLLVAQALVLTTHVRYVHVSLSECKKLRGKTWGPIRRTALVFTRLVLAALCCKGRLNADGHSHKRKKLHHITSKSKEFMIP